jgi:hypothetical protein
MCIHMRRRPYTSTDSGVERHMHSAPSTTPLDLSSTPITHHRSQASHRTTQNLAHSVEGTGLRAYADATVHGTLNPVFPPVSSVCVTCVHVNHQLSWVSRLIQMKYSAPSAAIGLPPVPHTHMVVSKETLPTIENVSEM